MPLAAAAAAAAGRQAGRQASLPVPVGSAASGLHRTAAELKACERHVGAGMMTRHMGVKRCRPEDPPAVAGSRLSPWRACCGACTAQLRYGVPRHGICHLSVWGMLCQALLHMAHMISKMNSSDRS